MSGENSMKIKDISDTINKLFKSRKSALEDLRLHLNTVRQEMNRRHKGESLENMSVYGANQQRLSNSVIFKRY